MLWLSPTATFNTRRLSQMPANKDTSNSPVGPTSGKVLLVGSGPGDPDLLTVKALKAIETADFILFDTLVAKPILDLAGPQTELINVGKKGYGHNRPQNEINALMLKLAQDGNKVVRLKSGDPLIFGRAGEEIETCQKAGIPFEIVPGITAAQGAAARLSVSLTHRHEARRLQYITGHDASGKLPTAIDWKVVADPQATTVVYMPRVTIKSLTEKAFAAGLDANTPAIIVINATRDNELQFKTTMGEIVDVIGEIDTTDPMLVLFGQSMHRAQLSETISRLRQDLAKGAA